ncbi:unnamed protein product [Brassica rapa subsp. trilocularis]
MKCAKTNNFRLGHKLKTRSCTTASVEHCLWPSSGIPTPLSATHISASRWL